MIYQKYLFTENNRKGKKKVTGEIENEMVEVNPTLSKLILTGMD